MIHRSTLLLVGLGGALALLAAPEARADVTSQCIEANTKAQALRRAGKWADARDALRLCGDDKCPAIVKSDCVQRLDELDRAQPSLVFDVKTEAGADVTQVKVSMDGKVVAERLGATALLVDPGEHSFVFEAPGLPTTTKTFVLREGDKGRRERVVLGEGTAAAAEAPGATPAPAPPVPPPQASGGGMSGQKTFGLVLGAAGLAGLAVGGIFGGLASSAFSSQKSDCGSASDCPNYNQAISDHNTTESDGLISTVAFIAGGALFATGAVLFLTGGSSSTASSTGLFVAPSVSPSAGGVDLRGRF